MKTKKKIFARFLKLTSRHQNILQKKHNRNIGMLVRKHFGGMLSDTKKDIFNLSDFSLSDTETFVLGNGLEFCIPPQTINREELFAEFEILQAQLAKHDISNPLGFNKLRAQLSDLAYEYSGSPIDHSDFLLHREHFQALKSLRANNDIFITKPDKGSGVVILNKKDYIKNGGNFP